MMPIWHAMAEMPVLEVSIADPRWEAMGFDAICQKAAIAALTVAGLPSAGIEISILATDDAEMTRLNGAFRDKQAPTNVLSWPSEERSADHPGGTPRPPLDLEIGDIALGFETCEREACENGVGIHQHVTHLVLHGILHLLGYDHISDEDATLMEGLEIQALERLGIANPY